jgi:uncharacterized protein GlcG (DUF336 family)
MMRRLTQTRRIPSALALVLFAGSGTAADVINIKAMSLELARDIAQTAVEACREKGYQVSAVVVDRSAVLQVVMRDTHASGFTIDIARHKAKAVVLAGVSTREFAANRPDLTPVLNHLEGLLVLQGGLPIRAAGSLVGAIGVSGAPGGDLTRAVPRGG